MLEALGMIIHMCDPTMMLLGQWMETPHYQYAIVIILICVQTCTSGHIFARSRSSTVSGGPLHTEQASWRAFLPQRLRSMKSQFA